MAKIAIFDSGIGGTTVLAAIRERAPWADLVYVADHAFGAYGERTLEEVRVRTELVARYLISAGVEEIVIACNSASAAALNYLREVLPDVAFVGMEPAVKPAAELTHNKIVGVLATAATFQGELFRSLVGRHGSDLTVVEQACPGLALAIENQTPTGDLLDTYIGEIVESGADVVVLGCTHYPLVRQDIESRLPEGTVIVDPSGAVAAQVLDVAHDVEIDLHGTATTRFWTTSLEPQRTDDRLWESIDIPADATQAIRVSETTLVAVEGDITTMPVSVVVNAANEFLAHGAGLARAIATAGGDSITQESLAWVKTYGPLSPGGAALTSAGAMPSSYVVHVAGPVYSGSPDDEENLAAAVLAALDTASEIDAVSVAVPAISAGIHGYPADAATQIIVTSVAGFAAASETAIRSVRVVGFDQDMAGRFAAAISSLT